MTDGLNAVLDAVGRAATELTLVEPEEKCHVGCPDLGVGRHARRSLRSHFRMCSVNIEARCAIFAYGE